MSKYENKQIIQKTHKLIKIINIIRIIDELYFYKTYLSENIYKLRSYKHLLDCLHNIETTEILIKKINNNKLCHVGSGLKKKIIEIIETGKLHELAIYKKRKDIKLFVQMSGIKGMGKIKIKKLIKKYKLKTMTDLYKKVQSGKIKLNNVQVLGLRHYRDLNTMISRDEINKIKIILNKEIFVGYKWIIVGSYRRMLPESGDIDIIVNTQNKTRKQINDVKKIIFIRMRRYFIGKLSQGDIKLSILARFFRHVRQLDIRFYSSKEYPAALLYFTGNKSFNIFIRGILRKSGYKLSDKGLFYRKSGKRVPGIETELDIIKFAGLQKKFNIPKNRNI